MVTQTIINDTVIHAKQWVATFAASLAQQDNQGDDNNCCLKQLYTVNTGIGVMQRYDTIILTNNILTDTDIKNVINVINSIINN